VPAALEATERRAVRPDHVSSTADEVAENGSDPNSATSVRAHFVDELGVPLAGVRLALVRDPMMSALSEGNGFADLALDRTLVAARPRALTFQASCPGFAPDQRAATPEAGKPLLLGEWPMVRSGVVEGRVVDERGNGVANADVACLGEELEERRWESERRYWLEALWRPAARARTEADGSFRLAEAPAGHLRLVAVTSDRPAGRSGFVDVVAGEVTSGVEIRMEAADGGTTITGIVLDPEGAAVAQASVKVVGERSSYGLTADEEGRFVVHLGERKPCDVTAADPERRHREATRRGVLPGTKDLVLQLTPAPRIELTVRSREGAPIEHFAHATISVKDAQVLAFSGEAERVQGLAELSAPGQDFRVEVRANGYSPARLGPFSAAAPPARLACSLDPAGGVHGVVETEGKPVVGATVALYRPVEKNDTYNGFLLRTRTAPEIEAESEEGGKFSLSVEEAGAYYLWAESEGYAPAEVGPLQLSPQSEREERIELGSGGTLEVRVRSAVGAPVAGTLVAISRGDGRARTVRADEHGLVLVRQLTPGGWLVALSKVEIDPDYGATYFGLKAAREVPTNCRVFAGETTRVDLWLEGEDGGDCRLEGRLVIDGKPAEGWLAGLTQERAELAEAQAFAEPGAFHLSADEPGSYRLSLRPDTADPSAMLAILDPVELYEGTSFWSLELETGVLEGTLGAASGEDELVFYRWQRGALQCFAPLVPGENGRFRCARAPAGRGALVRCDPSRPLEEQTPVVLRELTVEAGKTVSIEL
jgi:hypothetical protein